MSMTVSLVFLAVLMAVFGGWLFSHSVGVRPWEAQAAGSGQRQGLGGGPSRLRRCDAYLHDAAPALEPRHLTERLRALGFALHLFAAHTRRVLPNRVGCVRATP